MTYELEIDILTCTVCGRTALTFSKKLEGKRISDHVCTAPAYAPEWRVRETIVVRFTDEDLEKFARGKP